MLYVSLIHLSVDILYIWLLFESLTHFIWFRAFFFFSLSSSSYLAKFFIVCERICFMFSNRTISDLAVYILFLHCAYLEYPLFVMSCLLFLASVSSPFCVFFPTWQLAESQFWSFLSEFAEVMQRSTASSSVDLVGLVMYAFTLWIVWMHVCEYVFVWVRLCECEIV